MRLAGAAASLSLVTLLGGCATSVDPLGSGSAFDSGSVATDAGNDVSAKDTAVAPKDTAVTPTDTAVTPKDSGSPGDDTGSGDDTDPGLDSDLTDTAIDDTGIPISDATPGTCTVDTECTAPPFNCCDTTSGLCSVRFFFLCLPAGP